MLRKFEYAEVGPSAPRKSGKKARVAAFAGMSGRRRKLVKAHIAWFALGIAR
jgi:hypothetical protein